MPILLVAARLSGAGVRSCAAAEACSGAFPSHTLDNAMTPCDEYGFPVCLNTYIGSESTEPSEEEGEELEFPTQHRPKRDEITRVLDRWVDATRDADINELTPRLGSAGYLLAIRDGARPPRMDMYRLQAFIDCAEHYEATNAKHDGAARSHERARG
jgi:hypothetical protein